MLTARPFDAGDDIRRLCRFVAGSGTATVHAGDIQYKLSDPSLVGDADTRLWEDDGQLVGFAFVHLSCRELVFALKPCAGRREVGRQVMAWAVGRMRRAVAERGQPVYFLTGVREFDVESISLLESYGFTRDAENCVYLHHPLDREIPAPDIPAGMTLRHLAGAHELRAYVAAHRSAFWMDNLTVRWRRRVLRMPYYTPALDLLAVTPGGMIAACCLCWLEQDGGESNGVRKGYVQTLGTRPEFRNTGVGRALFTEALRRFQAHGAEVAFGQADAGNLQALRLYEAVGVRLLHRIYRYVWSPDDPPENMASATA